MNVEEILKQKAKTVTVRRDSHGTYWLEAIDVKKFAKLEVDSSKKETLVKLNDVLKILEGKMVVSKQKLRELAEAVKNRPSWEWMKDNLDKIEDVEFSFKQIEQNFAEFGLDTKKETKPT